MTKKQSLIFRIIFFVYIAAVLFLCFGKFDSSPSVPLSILGIPSDKIVHFCMFLPFPILGFLAYDRYTESAGQTLLFVGITLVAGLLLALFTELGQAHFTSYRSGDKCDFAADAIALLAGSIAVAVINVRKQRK